MGPWGQLVQPWGGGEGQTVTWPPLPNGGQAGGWGKKTRFITVVILHEAGNASRPRLLSELVCLDRTTGGMCMDPCWDFLSGASRLGVNGASSLVFRSVVYRCMTCTCLCCVWCLMFVFNDACICTLSLAPARRPTHMNMPPNRTRRQQPTAAAAAAIERVVVMVCRRGRQGQKRRRGPAKERSVRIQGANKEIVNSNGHVHSICHQGRKSRVPGIGQDRVGGSGTDEEAFHRKRLANVSQPAMCGRAVHTEPDGGCASSEKKRACQ